MIGNPDPRLTDAIRLSRFSGDLTGAAMQAIEQAATGSGENATLTEEMLRRAIYFGILGHLRDELEKHRNRAAPNGLSEPSGGPR